MPTDASKKVWANDIEEAAFRETQCARCFQPDEAQRRVFGTGPGCPHLLRAEANKMPKAWTPRRNAVMGEKYRCADRLDKPAVNRRKTAPAETEEMFAVSDEIVDFVPVENWPTAQDFGRKAKKEGDHA